MGVTSMGIENGQPEDWKVSFVDLLKCSVDGCCMQMCCGCCAHGALWLGLDLPGGFCVGCWCGCYPLCLMCSRNALINKNLIRESCIENCAKSVFCCPCAGVQALTEGLNEAGEALGQVQVHPQ